MFKRSLMALLMGAVLLSSIPATADVYDRLTGELITKDGLTYTGRPIMALRFDDGRIDPYLTGGAAAFLSKGIPLGMTLNAVTVRNRIATAGSPGGTELLLPAVLEGTKQKVSWQQVDELIVYARQFGPSNVIRRLPGRVFDPQVEILNHTYSTYDESGAGKAFGLTWANLLRELDPTEISDNLQEVGPGKPQDRIWGFAEPGDPMASRMSLRNIWTLRQILKDFNYEYSDLNRGGQGVTGVGIGFVASDDQTGLTIAVDPQGHFVRPGMWGDALTGMGPLSADIGTHFVERSAGWRDGEFGSNGTLDSWTIITDVSSGDITAANQLWPASLKHKIQRAIAMGTGLYMAMHDSSSSDANAKTGGWTNGGTGEPTDDEAEGNFSYEALARYLRVLWEQGFVTMVSPREYAEWASSDYAEGTDLLLWNSGQYMPAYAIGDTNSITVIPSIGGLGWWHSTSVWDEDEWWRTAFIEDQSRTGMFLLSSVDPEDFNKIGTALGPFGKTVGRILETSGTRMRFQFSGLPPGRYIFAHSGNNSFLNDVANVEEWHIGIVANKIDHFTSLDSMGKRAYTDSIVHIQNWSNPAVPASGTRTNPDVGETSHTYNFEFTVPEDVYSFRIIDPGISGTPGVVIRNTTNNEPYFLNNDAPDSTSNLQDSVDLTVGGWLNTAYGVVTIETSTGGADGDHFEPKLILLERY